MLRAGFGTKLAWLADPDQDVVFVGRDDADGHKAVELAAAVGVRNVAGYLHGGMTAWREEKRRVQRTDRLSVEDLHERWDARPDAMQILDVRENPEWDSGHIPGAVHVPYHDITGVPDGIDPGKPTAVICASGQRASVGASLLQRYGAEQVIHVVDGGMPLWRRRGWPVEERPTLAR
jgi:rhodanese-related sulfurtransferase